MNESPLDVTALAGTDDRVLSGWSPIEIKAVNDDSREILHLITTASRDRMDDIVEPKGARLQNYRKNPVVLVDHRYSIDSVIGRCVGIDAADDGLYARTRFEDFPLSDAAYNLAKAKLGGWSIGFRPLKRHTIKQGKDQKCKRCTELFDKLAEGKGPGDYVPECWGTHYAEWELLEYSCVAIPANQDVVNNAVSAGLVPADHVSKFFLVQAPQRPEESAAGGPTADAVARPDRPRVDPDMIRLMVEPALARIRRRIALRDAEERAAKLMRERV